MKLAADRQPHDLALTMPISLALPPLTVERADEADAAMAGLLNDMAEQTGIGPVKLRRALAKE